MSYSAHTANYSRSTTRRVPLLCFIYFYIKPKPFPMLNSSESSPKGYHFPWRAGHEMVFPDIKRTYPTVIDSTLGSSATTKTRNVATAVIPFFLVQLLPVHSADQTTRKARYS